MEPIVQSRLYGHKPGQPTFPIDLEIFAPARSEDYPDEWICYVRIPALDAKMRPRSDDPLQALCLALWWLRDVLRTFREEGGALSYLEDGDDDFSIEISFGLIELNPHHRS